MKKIALVIALAVASLSSAHAQTSPNYQTRFFVGTGFTGGGDEIATVSYTDGKKGDVSFGSLIQLGGGVDHRISEKLSIQASINYHVSAQGADNGNIRFTRVPVELIGYYHVSPQWRVGVGARYVSGAEISSSGVTYIGSAELNNTVGGIVEAEYALNDKLGIKLRYVAEKYEMDGLPVKASGNHVGVFGNFYF